MNEYSVVWETDVGLAQKNVWACSVHGAIKKVTDSVDSSCAECLIEVCEL
tara:strand:- start:909 stop:1058 length:150 start_codon:yes stop_codon:yes gene_type:complete